MKINLKNIGKRITDLRESHKPYLDQDELAAVLKVSQQRISRVERGESKPSLEFLLQIATYFEVTTDYILTGKTDNSPEIERIKLLSEQLSAAIKKI